MGPLEHMPLPAMTMVGRAGLVVENFLMVDMAVDDQLVERQRPPARLHAGLGFVVPVVFEFPIGLSEAAVQG